MNSIVYKVVEEADFQAMYKIYEPYVLNTAISFETTPPGPRQFSERIRSAASDMPWLVCRSGGSVAGYAYAGRHRLRHAYRFSVETSVYVHPDSARQGIGKGLYSALLGILVLSGYKTALAGITLPNEPSVKFHESMGFRPVGAYRNVGFKFGAWHDVGWWQKALADYDARPQEPVPFSAILGSEALQRILENAAI